MKTLVTGGGGFLGGHILHELSARGEPARALDLAYPKVLPDRVEKLEGSVLSPEDVRMAMAGVDCVIHAAAIAHLWSPGRFDYDRVNVVGTCRILAEARRTGARVVHVSSYTTLIGRDTKPAEILDERCELVPTQMLGPYPRTKRQAELAVLSACGAGVDATMVLPAAPVGPEDHRLTPPTALIRDLAKGALPALLACDLNLVDVTAVAAATVEARTKGRTGARYLLSGDDIAVTDLADRVAAITGVPAPGHRVPVSVALIAARVEAVIAWMTGKTPKAPLTGVRLAARPCRFSSQLAREELGFEPRPLDTCLAETLAWLRECGHLT